MPSLLTFSLDASELAKWGEKLSQYTIRLAAKNAINRVARRARNEAIKTIAADIGIPAARVKQSVSKLRTASPWKLSADWDAKAARIGILNTSGAKVMKLGGLTARTFRLTGGGSSSLSVGKAFVVKANGGRFVAYRKNGSRLPIKAIYAEHAATAIGQDNGAARVQWQRTVAAELPKELGTSLQAVLDSRNPPSDAGSNS